MATYLLCADVHLGRQSGDIPAHLAGYRTEDAWVRLCEKAVERGVSGIVVAGDLFDHGTSQVRAAAGLRQGLNILDGIPVYATAGNHDYELLPLIAKAFDRSDFIVIGHKDKDGWGDGELPCGLGLFGWSFCAETYTGNAWDSGHCPTCFDGALGVTHGSFPGSVGNVYHGIRQDNLRGAKFWLLGHYHGQKDGGHWGYPGSLQALDVNEQGERGAWLLDTETWTRENIDVSWAKYRRIEVEVTPEDSVSALVTRADGEVNAQRPDEGTLVARICFKGESELSEKEWTEIERRFEEGTGEYVVRSVVRDVRPPHNVEELAAQDGFTGRLARVVLSLRARVADEHDPYGDDAAVQQLIQKMKEAASTVTGDAALSKSLRTDYANEHDPDEDELRPQDANKIALAAAERVLIEAKK